MGDVVLIIISLREKDWSQIHFLTSGLMELSGSCDKGSLGKAT